MDKKKQLTSVEVNPEHYQEFKIACIRYKFSLHDLVRKSMHLFLTDETFRRQILNHNLVELSSTKVPTE